MIHRVFSLLLLAVLGGCSSTPDSIQVADETNLVSYPQAKANPKDNTSRQALWGGVIAKVENKKDHTLLEIVSYPLRGDGKPKVGDDSEGRFRVYVEGFLDPLVYEKGRTFTAKGVVSGAEQGSVGEHVYTYPKLEAQGHHLWRKVQRVNRVQPWGGAWGWGPGFGWGHPYFHPWYGYRWGFPVQRQFAVRGGVRTQVPGTRSIANSSGSADGKRIP